MKSLLALVAAILVSLAAHAAPPTDESIDALLTASKTQRTLEGVLSSMDQLMRQSQAAASRGQPLSAQQQRVMEAVTSRLALVIRDELSWSTMRSLYLQVYRESFTQEELDGVLAFYQSPAGVAFVEKMPFVMQKSIQLMQARMEPMIKRIQVEMRQAVDGVTGPAQ
jgi:hypothetical protein